MLLICPSSTKSFLFEFRCPHTRAHSPCPLGFEVHGCELRKYIYDDEYKSEDANCLFSNGYQKQECIPVGCVSSATVAVMGGCLPGGGGGCLPGRVCLPGGGVSDTPLPVNRITDRCKDITFPQLLLRTVNIRFRFRHFSA